MPKLHSELSFGEDRAVLPLRGSFDLLFDGIIQFIGDEFDDFVDGIVIPFRDVVEDQGNGCLDHGAAIGCMDDVDVLDVLDDGQCEFSFHMFKDEGFGIRAAIGNRSDCQPLSSFTNRWGRHPFQIPFGDSRVTRGIPSKPPLFLGSSYPHLST